MTTERLTAFSDGVIAIIITIMVLELKVPHSAELSALLGVVPTLLSYALSFVYIAIYWNNHHHMLHLVEYVNGPVLWANNLLLFWLSLVPFATAWLGENHFAGQPASLYGIALLLPAISYWILQNVIIHTKADKGRLAEAVGADVKGKISIGFYIAGIVAGFFIPAMSIGFYILVALIWFVPDRRVERAIRQE